MPAAGYAYAIYQISFGLKEGIFVNAQDNKFVQCVSSKLLTIGLT